MTKPWTTRGRNAQFGSSVFCVGSPGVSLIVNTDPSLNTPNLKVGATLASCAIAGSYTWPAGPVSESWSWLVDGATKTGTYVIAAGDAQIEAYVTLSATGLSGVSPIHLGPVSVTNSAPVTGNVNTTFQVAPGTGALSPFTTQSGQLTRFKDAASWPTTGGKITIAMDLSVAALGTTTYLYEMDNGHVSLQVVADGRLFLTIKDSIGTAILTSAVIGTITAATRFEAIVAADLAALNCWTTFNGTTTARTLSANSGNLASAARKLCLLARASGTTNNVVGTIYKLEVWADAISGGGRPASDALLRTDGRILGPATAANAHPWKLGGDTV